MNKRLHAYYFGSVQGVGFRYTAERVATSLHLTGWVKNLRGGRVEIVCEGRDPSLKEFLRKIESVFNTYISDKEIEWSDATGEFDYFDIKF
jgi:acylphosphatase